MNPETTTTPVPNRPQDSVLEEAVFCAVLAAALYLLMGMSACGVTAGGFTAGTTSFLQEANRVKLAGVRHEDN